MSKNDRQAGQNIRELALKRRLKAIISFTSAGFVIFIPTLLIRVFQNFLTQLSTLSSSHNQPTFNLPFAVHALFLFAAVGLTANGVYFWKRANHADQGAKGEEVVALEMSRLVQEGWQVEYGMKLGNRLGDADIICISPRNRAYVIDVKSHRGEVIADGDRLCRRMGKSTYPFEKDFLVQVVKQALQVKQQKSVSFVTPILVFSDAHVSLPNGKLRNVYVVERTRLVALLKSLG